MAAIASSVFGLKLVGIFIVNLRKCMMKKSTMKAVTFQGKKERIVKLKKLRHLLVGSLIPMKDSFLL